MLKSYDGLDLTYGCPVPKPSGIPYRVVSTKLPICAPQRCHELERRKAERRAISDELAGRTEVATLPRPAAREGLAAKVTSVLNEAPLTHRAAELQRRLRERLVHGDTALPRMHSKPTTRRPVRAVRSFSPEIVTLGTSTSSDVKGSTASSIQSPRPPRGAHELSLRSSRCHYASGSDAFVTYGPSGRPAIYPFRLTHLPWNGGTLDQGLLPPTQTPRTANNFRFYVAERTRRHEIERAAAAALAQLQLLEVNAAHDATLRTAAAADRYHHLHRRPRPPASPKRTVHEQSPRGEAADARSRSCEPGAAVDTVSEVQGDAHAGNVELPRQSDAQICEPEPESKSRPQSSASSSPTSASSASAGQAINASANPDEM